MKACLIGSETTETICEYVLDNETNEMKLVKKKVNEKTLPPNVDLIKIIFQQIRDEQNNELDYDKLTDEELEKERVRLLKELKEMENDSGKGKTKGKV